MSDVPVTRKIALTGGLDFWNTHPVPEADLPKIQVSDGPHGLRKQDTEGASDHVGLGGSAPATCFPPAVGLASTWNRELVGKVGAALGDEAKALGVGVLLGPGMNIKRDPRCGRNFEYFSEDPHVAGELATAFIKGVQGQGVGTSPKHFAANNQETDRLRRDSQVDERPLRDIYLDAFRKVVTQAQPWTIMCSYNKLNGTQVSNHHWLLTEVLKDEWGFEGLVVSDWGAVIDRVAALKAGLDLEMPANPAQEAAVVAALEAGEIDEATIDGAYERVARIVRKAAATLADARDSFDVEGHHALGRRAAEQAIVLLANDGLLPLAKDADVVVIGEFARTPRYQGAGSSRVNPTRVDNTLDRINELAGHEVPFAPGFTTQPKQELPENAHAEAVELAKGAGTVLMFLGLGESHESEGYDRDDIDLPAEQLALLEDVLAINENVVVVLSNGSSVALPFRDRVRAIVEGWLLGQAGGPALADVLYGEVNPSGKLTETIPERLEDVPSYFNFPGDVTGVRYGEGLFVGYRGYDKAHHEVAYPFGHGLSYTTFEYADVAATASGNDVSVSVTVTNTGEREGREVVQVYVSKPTSGVVRVPRELKAFEAVTLAPGASETLTLEIPADELAYWEVRDQAYVVEGGEYVVEVGSSSRDLRGSATVSIDGNVGFRPLTMHSTMGEALAVPEFADKMESLMGAFGGGDDDELGADMMKMMADFPIRGLVGFTGQDGSAIQAMLDEVNAVRGGGAA
ncbi:MAG: glycoside hydrolase family 3 C-terminal domain-containing protein [Propionibacteriaceae bacterium]|nr:glycoside hydrolase family 3 C-terminal domain-containing protein [Propionibacteriaceae bacterium]